MSSRWLIPFGRNANRGISALRGQNLPATRFNRPWNTLSVMEDSLRDMDRHFNRMFRDINSLFRDFNVPHMSFSPEDMLGIQSEIVKEGDKNKFKMMVKLGEGFTPENVKVTLKDRLMTIEAKLDEKSEDGNSRIYQEITRKITLPEHVDVKELKSIMEPDGILKVEALVPPEALPQPPEPKEIPIQLEKKLDY